MQESSKVTLKDTLLDKKTSSPAQLSLCEINGDIEPDLDPDYFRVYPRPKNRSNYLLLKRADQEIEKWSSEELAAADKHGQTMYRLRVPLGLKVLAVSVSVHVLGETIEPPNGKSNSIKSDDEYYCRSSERCFTGCCEEDIVTGYCWCSQCCIGKQKQQRAERSQGGSCSCKGRQ